VANLYLGDVWSSAKSVIVGRIWCAGATTVTETHELHLLNFFVTSVEAVPVTVLNYEDLQCFEWQFQHHGPTWATTHIGPPEIFLGD
jgi:hypothetical protein